MGAEHARLLVGEGAKVVIGDILDEKGQALADEIGESARTFTSTPPNRTSGTPRSTWPSAHSDGSMCW